MCYIMGVTKNWKTDYRYGQTKFSENFKKLLTEEKKLANMYNVAEDSDAAH